MRVAQLDDRVVVADGDRWAATEQATVLELIHEGGARATEVREVDEQAVRAPLRPRLLVCTGINYRSHLEENPGAVLPDEPVFFSKLPSAIVGPNEPIVLPEATTQADYEVELAIVIGRRARRVSAATGLDYVFGYTIVNDISARDVQFRPNQLTLGKGPDTFAPIGPWIVTADEIPDPSRLMVRTEVNGEERQSSPTSAMLFSVGEILAALTRYVTLEAGDVVTTGTPAGVAAFRTPEPWLRPGDVVTVEVDAIGRLTNPVVAGW